jgi:hypothetical protein
MWVLLSFFSRETTHRIVDNANLSKYWYKNALLNSAVLKLELLHLLKVKLNTVTAFLKLLGTYFHIFRTERHTFDAIWVLINMLAHMKYI